MSDDKIHSRHSFGQRATVTQNRHETTLHHTAHTTRRPEDEVEDTFFVRPANARPRQNTSTDPNDETGLVHSVLMAAAFR